MIEFTKADLNKVINVMAALKRGKYEVDGEEVLAFAQSFAWLSQLADKIKTQTEMPLVKPLLEPIEKAFDKALIRKAKK